MISSPRGQLLVGGKYEIHKLIGSGSFGEIFRGINITTKKYVAIKIESSKARFPTLSHEKRVYGALQGGLGVPKVYWGDTEILQGNESNVLVMDLLGPSLEDLFIFCSKKFTMKTILMLAEQMIERIEFMHSKCFLHRDIKPNNFLMGVDGERDVVSLIDLGLAKKFRESGQHIDYRDDRPLLGTERYVSLNVHMGDEHSRRDDLLSLGYVLIYFNRGILPWQGLKAETRKQKYAMIKEMKASISEETLCKGLPTEFILYLNYCRSLGFYDKPDYSYLRHLFRDLFQRLNYQLDFKYDWTVLKEKGVTGWDYQSRGWGT